jgi:hypothetical protein
LLAYEVLKKFDFFEYVKMESINYGFEISIAMAIFCELIKKYIQNTRLSPDADFDTFTALVRELPTADIVTNAGYYKPIFLMALHNVRNSDIFDNLYDTNYDRRMTDAIKNVVVIYYKIAITQWILSEYGRQCELDISYDAFIRNNPGVEYYRLYYPVNGRAIFEQVRF